MAEKKTSDRIEGGIEAVGFYPASDPERIEEIEAMQKMYERLADEIRTRKGIPFTKVMNTVEKKSAQAENAAKEAAEADSATESGEESPRGEQES
jgi:hypothetical protein